MCMAVGSTNTYEATVVTTAQEPEILNNRKCFSHFHFPKAEYPLHFPHQNAKSPMSQECSFCTFRPISQNPLYIWRQKVAHSIVLEMGNLLIEVRSKIHLPHKCRFLMSQATFTLISERRKMATVSLPSIRWSFWTDMVLSQYIRIIIN